MLTTNQPKTFQAITEWVRKHQQSPVTRSVALIQFVKSIHYIAEVNILSTTINYFVPQLSFDRSTIDPEPRFDERLHIFTHHVTHHVCYQNEAVMDLTHACTTVMLLLLLLTCSAIQTNKSSSEEYD